jgi:hypothetical protein
MQKTKIEKNSSAIQKKAEKSNYSNKKIHIECFVVLVTPRKMWVFKEMNGPMPNEGPIFVTLFQDQARLTTVNKSDIHTHSRTRLLTEWQER